MNARPTTHRGIQMRSRLESKFARYLDSMSVEFKYEPRAFSGKSGEYLPDFQLTEVEVPLFVEVKPTFRDIAAVERGMERMEIIWESEPDAALMMVFGDVGFSLRTEGRRWEVITEDGLPGWDQARVAYLS